MRGEREGRRLAAASRLPQTLAPPTPGERVREREREREKWEREGKSVCNALEMTVLCF